MNTVLNREKNKVRQSFSAAANSYDDSALLQRQVGLDLISLFNINVANQQVMDLGCGTGFLMQQLMPEASVQQMIAVDISLSMLQIARIKSQHFNNVQYVCANVEKLPFSGALIDTAVSNLALQWCRDLLTVFQGFKQVLKPNGRLIFTTFGAKTLQELRQSWLEVDRYTHVNDFYTQENIKHFLLEAEFKEIQIESKCYNWVYPSVMALMRELKDMGANQVLSGRNKKITSRLQMQAMLDVYEQHRVNGVIPVTYEVIFVSAISQ
jgi:malonyl-CoA O-methyltransferase